MVSVRSAKSKGSAFEYDVQYSLSKKYPDTYLTKQRGFQLMYDVQSDDARIVIECKRLKGISWNQLIALFHKLHDVMPAGYTPYICFKSNHQPCLVFDGWRIIEFKDAFESPFLKHEPVQRKKKEVVQ